MVAKLSKSESKYRYKFIYENHLNKMEQQQLDRGVASKPDIMTPYKQMYLQYRNGDVSLFLSIINMTKLYDASAMLGMSIDELGEAYQQLINSGENTDVVMERVAQSFRRAAMQSAGIPICMD